MSVVLVALTSIAPASAYSKGEPQTLRVDQWQNWLQDPYTTDNVGSGTPESTHVNAQGSLIMYTSGADNPNGYVGIIRATSLHTGKDLETLWLNLGHTTDRTIILNPRTTKPEIYHYFSLNPRGKGTPKGKDGWQFSAGWPWSTYGQLVSGLLLNVSLYPLKKDGTWAKDAKTGLPKGAPAYANTFRTGKLHVYSTSTPAADCVITVTSGSLLLAGRTASGLVGALAPGQTGTYSAGMALLLDGETALLQGKKSEALDLFIDHHLESQTDAVKEQVWEQLKSKLGKATKVGDKGIVTVNKIPFSFKVMKRVDGALGKASSFIDEVQTTYKNWQWISGVATKVCGS
jgi:hypothetical protein